jgi:RNA polymerase sigma-70 factor, ECF subfamily
VEVTHRERGGATGRLRRRSMIGIRIWGECGRPASGEASARAETEGDLLLAGRSGDRTALEQLLTPFERPLFAVCRGMLGHAEDAEDAVQETFLRALHALPAFRSDGSFRTWLFRIAVNVCLERRRSHRPTQALDDHAPLVPDPGDSPEAIVVRDVRLREALAALLPRQRAILLLKELEGWSVARSARRWAGTANGSRTSFTRPVVLSPTGDGATRAKESHHELPAR